MDGLKGGKRTLGTHQKLRQIQAAVFGIRPLTLGEEDIKVVATNPSHDFGPYVLDVVLNTLGNLKQS